MTDETFNVYEEVWSALHGLLDERLSRLTPDEETDVRDRLQDEFRFWRRNVRSERD